MKTKSSIKSTRQHPDSGLQNRSEQPRSSNGIGTATAAISTSPDSAPSKPVQSIGKSGTMAGAASTWRGVFFSGPEPVMDRRQDDEIPVWTVFVGDEDANAVSRVYHVYSFAKAEALAQAMARDRRLELINEATTA